MADLQSTLIGALQQAGLKDPQMLAQISAAVMAGLKAPQQPGGPAWSNPAPMQGWNGQRDLIPAGYGRGPTFAPIDPRAAGDIQAGIAREFGAMAPVGQAMGQGAMSQLPGGAMPGPQGLQPPAMMPPGSPPMGPATTALPGQGALSLASDAMNLEKPDPPVEPGLKPKAVSVMKKPGKKPAKSESDILNEQELARIKARRGMLGSAIPQPGMLGGM